MPVSERAKQFMPFAAVKGLTEALARKEKVSVAKVELSEEMSAELNQKLYSLQKGVTAAVTYYCDGEYLKVTGIVTKPDAENRTLLIDDTRISFDDLLGIDILE
jgi:membrane-bound inhibitor of C-type lysozyme